MALSSFDDKSRQPSDTELASMLGKTIVYWEDLKGRIARRFDPVTIEWGFTSKSTGWGLRIKSGKRVIIYMTPCERYFRASFALGEKAVMAAQSCGLPASILKAIDAAPRYAEGRGVRFEVKTAALVPHLEKLAICKMTT